MQTRLRLIVGLCLIFGATLVLARVVAAEAAGGRDGADVPCNPFSLLTEFFDGVTPPALPTGWSSTTWVTS